MAWVRLIDLLAEDKNTRGTISMDAVATFIAGVPEEEETESRFCAFPLLNDSDNKTAKFIQRMMDLDGKKILLNAFISDYSKDANSAEWGLNGRGRLYYYTGPVEKNGKFGTAIYCQLDITDWLKQQTPEHLAKICKTQSRWWREETDSHRPKTPRRRVQSEKFHQQLQKSLGMEIPFLDETF